MWPFTSAYPEVRGRDVDGQTFDYIIVGGGTSGCVLARRLSEDPSVTVLVLEKGHVNDNLYSRIPLMSQNMLGPFLQAMYRWSEPVAAIGGRSAQLWTTEGMGGATRINGGLVTRGSPVGYKAWKSEFGLTDWGWESLEPWFRGTEKAVGKEGSPWRGQDGLVENRQPEPSFRVYGYFEKAARQMGLTITKDANDPAIPASVYTSFDRTISATGRRWSVLQAYLGKAIALERKDRLKVCTGVIGSKLDIEKTSGVVKGVYFQSAGQAKRKDGKAVEHLYAKARGEVILCSGVITTPQLLLLSGVGPAADLKEHGIPLVVDQPHVGAELRDHYAFPVQIELPQNETLAILNNPLVFIWEFLKWLFFGIGILAQMTTPTSAFIRTASLDPTTMKIRHDPDTDAADQHGIPDIEVMHTNIDCVAPSFGGPSLTSLFTTLVQPFSKGRITLASTDPADHPRVEYPMLTDPRDWETLRLGLKFAMRYADEICGNVGLPFPAKLVYAPGMDLKLLDEAVDKVRTLPKQAYGTGQLSFPLRRAIEAGMNGDSELSEKTALLAKQTLSLNWETTTDEEIKAFAQRVGASSLHFGCSCRMGLTKEEGVVDQRLKVFGLRNLRIADASVFPRLPSSHTMAPTIVVAERCADFIRREWADKKTQ